MNQDEVRREDRRPLDQAVEQQAQALEQVGETLHEPGPREQELQQAVEEVKRQAETVQRELGHQTTGTVPKAGEEGEAPPETAPHEPIGGLG
jgi:tape measure domain-containing protein